MIAREAVTTIFAESNLQMCGRKADKSENVDVAEFSEDDKYLSYLLPKLPAAGTWELTMLMQKRDNNTIARLMPHRRRHMLVILRKRKPRIQGLISWPRFPHLWHLESFQTGGRGVEITHAERSDDCLLSPQLLDYTYIEQCR